MNRSCALRIVLRASGLEPPPLAGKASWWNFLKGSGRTNRRRDIRAVRRHGRCCIVARESKTGGPTHLVASAKSWAEAARKAVVMVRMGNP